MGCYGTRILPRLLDHALDTPDIRRIRTRVTADLAGEVVEVGFGTGLNLPHLPASVTRVLAVEPSALGVRLAAERIAASGADVDVIGPDAQRLPLPDASVDAALCAWTLCTIVDPVAAVRELRRVLRPGERLHFVEHGIAPDESVRRWQRRLNPLQRRMAGGCVLDRDIPALLRRGGMAVTQLQTYYGHDGPRLLSALYEGRAVAVAEAA